MLWLLTPLLWTLLVKTEDTAEQVKHDMALRRSPAFNSFASFIAVL